MRKLLLLSICLLPLHGLANPVAGGRPAPGPLAVSPQRPITPVPITPVSAASMQQPAPAPSVQQPSPTHSGWRERCRVQPTPGVCLSLAAAARVANSSLEAGVETAVTADRKITCVRKAGFTLDYQACARTVQHYNYIVAAEKGLQLAQQVRLDNKQRQIGAEVNQRMAQGDGQVATIDAANASGEYIKSLNEEQKNLYITAVAALSGSITAWPDPKERSYRKLCEGKELRCFGHLMVAVEEAGRSEVFANDQAKGAFWLAVGEFTSKGIKAGINASQFKRIANPNQDDMGNDPNNPHFNKCVYSPLDPACRGMGPGQRVAGAGIETVNWNASGASGGNNTFGSAEEAAAFGEHGAEGGAGGERIGDLKSPFYDVAREASGILDPAAAATPGQGGGGAGGGGGGGAGAGGGGGGGGLPGDLKGVAENQENKEAEIKSNKFSGNYAEAGAQGFQALKGSKEETVANPFASLFDGKGEAGGVEEDRSIASDDGSGPSGLFQKISRRYGLVVEDKRIEANNLE
jgi:hypothetical protein